MKEPLVTVIIPCWGEYLKYLPRCLNSIGYQTYKNLEILVVTKIENAPRACNAAWDRAKGKYIAFLGADDTWYPDKIKEQVAVMESEPYCLLCTCWSEDNRFGMRRISKAMLRVVYEDMLKAFNYSSGSTYMIRNNTDLRFDESLLSGQEYDLALRLLKYSPSYAYCIPKILVTQYSTPGQISCDWTKKIKGIYMLAKKYGKGYTMFDWFKVAGLLGLYFSAFILGDRIYRFITIAKEKYE